MLKSVDLVVCEEYKNGRKLLKKLEINVLLEALNEHNEEEKTPTLIHQLREGASIALISDCGTPVFADPGGKLVCSAIDIGIRVTSLPGASSLLASLVCSGLNLTKFHYRGFLARTKEERRRQLKELQHIRATLILYEAPYRLLPLLRDVQTVFGQQIYVVISFRMTFPDEEILRGPIGQLLKQLEKAPRKAEFVLLLDNQKSFPYQKNSLFEKRSRFVGRRRERGK